MKGINTTVASLLLLLTATTVAAEPKEFKQADVNADGFLDQQEFINSGAESPFADFDANKDERISKKEYEDKLQECE